jgi:integrase
VRLQDYDERDGKQVWLDQDDVDRLLDTVEVGDPKRAVQLGVRCGLRRSEIVSVTVGDVMHAPDGFLRVWEDYAKRSKYRETPLPNSLESVVIDGLSEHRQPEDELVQVTGSTVYRWIQRAGEELYAETGDEGWTFLDVHDLRRTWGADLLWNYGLLPSSVMAFGGWEDWSTFRNHYLGEMSPEAARRERSKVDWMGGAQEEPSATPSSVFEPRGSTREDRFAQSGYRE